MVKINGEEIKITKFPNGESCVPVEKLNSLNSEERVRLEFKWYNDEDILHLYFVLNHLNVHGITKRDIYVYYMTYSRMDRDQNGNCFTLDYVTKLLNTVISSKSDKVFVIEPHSDVTLDKLTNSSRVNVITPLMNKILEEQQIDIICYPDKGARNRFGNDVVGLPIVYCNKRRDFDTGKILGLDLVSDVSLKDKNVLILDDLCSKGGTFYYTAKKLKEEGAKDVLLGVCHMETTVQYGEIIKPDSDIKHIYCTDSMMYSTNSVLSNSKLTVYDLEKFLREGVLVPIVREEVEY